MSKYRAPIEPFPVARTRRTNKHATNDTMTSTKTTTKQLDVTKHAQVEELTVKKSLNVQGSELFHDSITATGLVVFKDKLQQDSSFVLTDRIESYVGH